MTPAEPDDRYTDQGGEMRCTVCKVVENAVCGLNGAPECPFDCEPTFHACGVCRIECGVCRCGR